MQRMRVNRVSASQMSPEQSDISQTVKCQPKACVSVLHVHTDSSSGLVTCCGDLGLDGAWHKRNGNCNEDINDCWNGLIM